VALADIALHVVQRGHSRRECFFHPSDYTAYLDFLRIFAVQFGCSVHAFCLMTNHVHLLMTPQTDSACARTMKFTSQSCVQRINRRLGRTGTLWEGRFYSCPVATDRYVIACYRYIDRNPVEAGMVRHAGEYAWSSYGINTDVSPDDFIVPHPACEALGTDGGLRAKAYAELCAAPVEPKLVEEIRKATRRGFMVGATRRPRGRPRPSVMRKMGSVPI